MRENRTPGSVQGAPGNRCSYCDSVINEGQDEMMKDLHVVACGKGTFAGAATIKCKFLSELVCKAKSVTYITDQYPRAAEHLTNQFPIEVIGRSTCVSSIGSLDAISVEIIAESIVGRIRAIHRNENILIWASHIFPYLNAAINAKQILKRHGYSVKLLAFPVGSDIWEIGPQVPNVFESRMLSKEVDYWATYSERFAVEIAGVFPSLSKRIRVIPPVIDVNNRLYEDNFDNNSLPLVLSCHCNMRPVKRIDQTIKLAGLISQAADRDIKLMIIGPAEPHEIIAGRVRVIYRGLLDDPLPLVRKSAFNINTSIHDSFNYALLEAMANGVPQITSDVAGISEHIASYNTGLVLPIKLIADAPIYEQYESDIFDEEEVLAKLKQFFVNLTYSALVENCYKCCGLFSSELFISRFSSLINEA